MKKAYQAINNLNTHLALYGESETGVIACIVPVVDFSYSFALQKEK